MAGGDGRRQANQSAAYIAAAFDQITSKMQFDREWMTRDDRSLFWLGHRLGQTFTAVPHRFRHEAEHLTGTVPVLNGVDPTREVLIVLNELNRTTCMDAWYADPNRGQVLTAVSIPLEIDTLGLLRPFTFGIAMQIAYAEEIADQVAASTGGRIAVIEHPTSGTRTSPDQMLEILDEESLGTAPLLLEPQDLVDLIQSSSLAWEIAPGPNDAAVAACRIPIGGDYPDYEFGLPGEAPTTFAITLHPRDLDGTLADRRRIGPGITFDLTVTGAAEAEVGLNQANRLNFAEASGTIDSYGLGAWSWADGQLSHRSFLPAKVLRLASPDEALIVLRDFTLASQFRARYALEFRDS